MTIPLIPTSRLSAARTGLLLGLAVLMTTGSAFAQGGPQRDDQQQQPQHQSSRQDNDKGANKGADKNPAQNSQQHSNAGPDRSQEQRGNSNEHRNSNTAKPNNTARQDDRHYDFGQNDRSRLQAHYRSSINKVDRDKRPSFQAGHEIPRAYRAAITPAPESLRRRLPTPPSGYQIGYYQGYTVVYDPTSFVILTLIDLLG